MLEPFERGLVASYPSGGRSQQVARDMVEVLLVDGACTCCCIPAGPDQADFERIGSSVHWRHIRSELQTVLVRAPGLEPGPVPEPGLELGLGLFELAVY